MKLVWIGLVFSLAAFAADDQGASNFRYRSGKTVELDLSQVQGDLRRPEISVVTGDEKEKDNGLLRLRQDFNDRIAIDCGEEMP